MPLGFGLMSHRANDEMDARLLTGVSENSTYDPLREGLPGWPPDPIVDDPMAIELVKSIDFDFENSDAKVRR